MGDTAIKRYMTVRDLARHMGRSTDTLYRMEARGELPARITFGRRRVWFGPSIEAWERDLRNYALEKGATGGGVG